MNTPIKLAAYAGGLAVIFAAALGLGAATGSPIDMSNTHDTTTHGGHADAGTAVATAPAGLQVSEQGYTLSEVTAPIAANNPGALNFRILGPSGAAVTEYDELHEKQLHLIVVRSDTSEFRHVHPVRAADGTWSVDWSWPRGGTYRVFADFQPTGGPQLTLGRNVDVAAPGPGVSFHAQAPSDGTYRLFLDFQHENVVRTAEFTVSTHEGH